ncbi:MAG TPA: hypothetical protein VNX65_01345 [Patescibacteria group bacterium]|nr:hypothetical protein [Patescibacteria group bacterium]
MAKFLRDLLDAKEPLFSLSLRQLEKASGHHGTDTKLIGDIIEQAHQATKQLQLDNQDTTGPELYQALLAQVAKHDRHLATSIGGKDVDNVLEMQPLILKAVEKIDMPRSCWVLKNSVAKDFLRQNPPKEVMKVLGHSSVESMLKHENLAEVFGALRFAESPEWLSGFNDGYSTVQPTDFVRREIQIVQMPIEKWGNIARSFIAKKRHNITHLKELGVILVLPLEEEYMKGITLKILPLILHYFNEIRLYSAFFKLKQVQPGFGKIFADTLNADPDLGPIMAGQNVHWRVIQRYFGKLGDEAHPEIFSPHVQPEDLHWRSAEETLYRIDPELAFWRNLDYVGVLKDNLPISFNLMDISLSYSNDVPYEKHYVYHFRESLWNEIFMRYMGHKNLESQVLKQLDNDMISPEKLSV